MWFCNVIPCQDPSDKSPFAKNHLHTLAFCQMLCLEKHPVSLIWILPFLFRSRRRQERLQLVKSAALAMLSPAVSEGTHRSAFPCSFQYLQLPSKWWLRGFKPQVLWNQIWEGTQGLNYQTKPQHGPNPTSKPNHQIP